MKKILFLAAVLTASIVANAKTWRINPNPAAKPDFLSLKEACDTADVVYGDTLYCEPGQYNVAEENVITKKGLTLIGPGYQYKMNYGSTSTVAEATFSAGINIQADSIHVEGVKATQISLTGAIKDVVIERNYIGRVWSSDYSYRKRIAIRSNYITQNYGPQSGDARVYLFGSELSEIDIENNIIVAEFSAIQLLLNSGQALSAVIAHNTMYGGSSGYSYIRTAHSEIRDNIIILKEDAKTCLHFEDMVNSQIYNNVFSLVEADIDPAVYAQIGEENHFIGATLENTFTCQKVAGADDSYYQLKEGSVAAGKAFQHEDCGAFAGTWPYVIHGRPQSVPYIFDVVAPHRPVNDQLTITFKVKANNE